MGDTNGQSRLRPRRIIERPRLMRLLDGSTARVRMLIAPAGYGKTTLAEQWTPTDDRRVAWYPCRPSSADVAVLSVGIARAAADLLPGCDQRLTARVQASRNPPAEVEVFAELLAENFSAWPDDGWLVIDDYQFVCSVPETERFVEILIERSPVNVLLASRRRPAWATSRSRLYGAVFEVDQAQLAMDHAEADDVLREQPATLAADLIALARGLPAVIGLAGVTTGDAYPAKAAQGELYDYFAHEVFRQLDPDVQTDLGLLVVAPALDRDLAAIVLESAERADRSIARALSIGVLEERGDRLDFHPLARGSIGAVSHPDAPARVESAIDSCLEVYRERKDWDSAFEIVAEHGTASDLDTVVRDALDDLLHSGRLATVETWVQHASERGVSSPYLTVAAAEVNMRRGQLSIAETLIHRVLDRPENEPGLQFRALKIAGQVAHLASREVDGLEYFTRAEAVAPDEPSKRDARWGLVIGMAALEQGKALELLDKLERDTRVDDPKERIRLAGRRLSMAMRFGDLPPIERARQVEQLLELVGDPTARCSFRSVYSSALVLAAHYHDACRVAGELIGDGKLNRVDFGLTYGHAVQAAALAGLRRFEDAHDALDSALDAARRCTDLVGEQNVYATRVRVLIQENRPAAACALEPPDLRKTLPGIRGEVLASRGLALASVGRVADAMHLAEEAARSTQSLEGAVLTAAIHAVLEVRAGGESAFDAVEALLDTAIARGGLDLFVTCYRGNLGILRLLLAGNRTSERTLFVLARAGDQHLAAEVGSPSDVVFDPFSKLTKREREVCALLCEGLSDREIGKQLFITRETAKRHALRILQKTGFKSRRALALAVRPPLDQAAPTATFGDAGTSAVS